MKQKINSILGGICSTCCLLYACHGMQKAPRTTIATPETTSTYLEQHRPQFHFSPPAMWMNDPNGLVFFEGEYHLFYQYYPERNVWGPMHWGHAVSRDLVHWEQLPIALYPDSLGYIFFGSAAVDWSNTSGFGENGKPPLVAMFTLHNMTREKAGRKDVESQGIAYSNDRGRTWTKYSANPVLPNTENQRDFRDPKIVWHEASKKWIVVLAVGDHAEFWSAPDLIHWTHLSDFGKEYGAHGGVWECPDFFPIRVEGTSETKWVLLQNLNPGGPNGGSCLQYFVGQFDGKTFSLDPDFAKSVSNGNGIWVDWGKDNYAGVTWSDLPKSDGRRLLLGWMSNWEYAQEVPTVAWRNAATLPRELVLTNTSEGYRFKCRPVKELKSLRKKSFELPKGEITEKIDLSDKLKFSPAQSEWVLEFKLPEDLTPAVSSVDRFRGSVGIELSNAKGETYRIGYDGNKNQFFSDRTKSGDHSFSKTFAAGIHTAPRISKAGVLRIHLYFDVASAELFADDGSTVMTELYFPTEIFNQAKIFVEGEKLTLSSGSIYALSRIWK